MRKFAFTSLERRLIANTFKAIESLYDLDDSIQAELFGEQIGDSKITIICNDMFGSIRKHLESIGVNVAHMPEEVTKAREEGLFYGAVDLLEKFIREELESCQTQR